MAYWVLSPALPSIRGKDDTTAPIPSKPNQLTTTFSKRSKGLNKANEPQ